VGIAAFPRSDRTSPRVAPPGRVISSHLSPRVPSAGADSALGYYRWLPPGAEAGAAGAAPGELGEEKVGPAGEGEV